MTRWIFMMVGGWLVLTTSMTTAARAQEAPAPTQADAAEPATVSGTLIANGETIELPYVYVWAAEEGLYDESDPAWTLLFLEHPVEERELAGRFFDSAWVRIGVTETAEFRDGPELRVYEQSLKLSADSGGNLTGGTYPEIEFETAGPDRFTGRVYHAEPQEIFGDTFQYDFTFSAPLSDPHAPLGEALPAGGGEPGRAYLRWVAAIHDGDVEALRAVVPTDMATQLDRDEAQEELEFMRLMTPTEVTVLGGSSDGETAILEVEGVFDGERVSGEVTLARMGDFWIPTESSW